MITELIPTINEVIKFGLEPHLKVNNNDIYQLEKSLVNIYSLYFEINYEFDPSEFKDYDEHTYKEIRANVESNFSDFGFYNTALDLFDLNKKDNFAIGDSIDDLSDIILDLLQIKWRVENNSLNDGLWYFQWVFASHTQQHLIDFLKYLKERD